MSQFGAAGLISGFMFLGVLHGFLQWQVTEAITSPYRVLSMDQALCWVLGLQQGPTDQASALQGSNSDKGLSVRRQQWLFKNNFSRKSAFHPEVHPHANTHIHIPR